MGDFAKPGPEHARLRRLTGAWTARIKYFPEKGAAPQESTGEFLARMDVGGYFLFRDLNFGMQGFQGRGMSGYDPFQKKYVGTWIDASSPIIYPTEGHFDEKGSFCETSEGPDADGVVVRLRLCTDPIDPNHMLFRIWRVIDAEEWIMLEIEHLRRRFVD